MTAVRDFERAQQALLDAHGLRAERFAVEVGPIGRVHGFEVGSGPPLLFVIGGGAPGAMWSPLVAELDGYRRVVVDRPGFGLTPAVPHRPGEMRRLADDFVGGVLDALELDDVTLVANSMGAWWSIQHLLGTSSRRVGALVSIGCPALLLETGAPLPTRLLGVRGLGDLMVRLQPASTTGARQTCRMMGDPLGEDRRDTAMAELLAAAMRLPGFRRTWVDLLHAFVRVRGPRREMAITADDLRRLDLPVQFVWGGDGDPFGPPDAGRRAARMVPDATFARVPGGHVPWVTDAAAVGMPIRTFLSEHAETNREATR